MERVFLEPDRRIRPDPKTVFSGSSTVAQFSKSFFKNTPFAVCFGAATVKAATEVCRTKFTNFTDEAIFPKLV